MPAHQPDLPTPIDPVSDADGPAPPYRMNEGAFRLPGAWEDRTVTLLRPSGSDGGPSIVVTRDRLPPTMALEEYTRQQRQMFQQQLPGFALLQEKPGELDAHPSHLWEFHWDSQGVALYQAVVVVLREGRLLTFTASAPRDAADVETRRSLMASINSFRFAEEPEALA